MGIVAVGGLLLAAVAPTAGGIRPGRPEVVLDAELVEVRPIPSVVELVATDETPTPESPTVKVLGPVEVVGWNGQLRSGQVVELLALLATHPRGLSRQALVTGLWPDRAPSGASFNNLVSAARSQLGTGADGEWLLPRVVRGGSYRLSSQMECDLAKFEHLAEPADDPESESERLGAAMALVRGRPFASDSGFEWAFGEGLVAHAERRVSNAAHRLCQLSLEADDPDRAAWVAAQGLRACPEDEVLARDAMAAAHAAGNPGGVESTIDALASQLEPGEDIFEVLHPDTMADYRRFGHGGRGRRRARVRQR